MPKKITEQIVDESRAEYVIALKMNQPALYQAVDQAFQDLIHEYQIPYQTRSTLSQDHGRDEIRRYYVCHDIDMLSDELQNWRTIKAIGMVQTSSDGPKGPSENRRYFILSKNFRAKEFSEIVRGHWGIENKLHYKLDVATQEDDTPIKSRSSNRILAGINRLVMNICNFTKKGIKQSLAKSLKECLYNQNNLEEKLQLMGF